MINRNERTAATQAKEIDIAETPVIDVKTFTSPRQVESTTTV